jgi:hypothetical protein
LNLEFVLLISALITSENQKLIPWEIKKLENKPL